MPECPICGKDFIKAVDNSNLGFVMFVHQITPYRGNKINFKELEGCQYFLNEEE